MRQSAEPGTAAAAADEALRKRILGAAFAAFLERGYGGASTLEIATRAKVSKRALYALFSSKEAMLAACVAGRARHMYRALELPLAGDRAALAETLVAFGTALLAGVCRPEVIALYRLAALEVERSPEVARTLHAEGREPNRLALVDLLARAQASGLLPAGEPAAMAAQFFGLLWGDLLLGLVLRVTELPDAATIAGRARAAAAALLALHPLPKG